MLDRIFIKKLPRASSKYSKMQSNTHTFGSSSGSVSACIMLIKGPFHPYFLGSFQGLVHFRVQ